jgi:glycosyltransferase involved in cell wall biosynthesis
MLAGLPVVATAIPALHEIFDACDDASLFPIGDMDAYAARMRPLLHDRDRRERIGANNRARVLRDFAPDRMVQGYLDLLQ